MVHILYLVHDLSDAAVRRRISMMRAGGARVSVAGFRRTPAPVPAIDGQRVIDLGRTEDGAFAKRMLAVAGAATRLRRRLGSVRPDVVVARNLEMLLLARLWIARDEAVRLVYEVLDIHRLMLGRGSASAAMRRLERSLMRRASLLLTSSPAFAREYFRSMQNVQQPIRLVENKVVELSDERVVFRRDPSSAQDRPLTIGWFGALRCLKSLNLLAETSRRMQGKLRVVLRGRPAYREFPDFDGFVAAEPYLEFRGGYRSPEDLPEIYGEVDLVWTVDFFEAGLNSEWLLPNRLYEGCLHAGVPVAMRGTETARHLADLGVGVLLERDDADALTALLESIDGARLIEERRRVAALDRGRLVYGRGDCEELVRLLGEGAASARVLPVSAVGMA